MSWFQKLLIKLNIASKQVEPEVNPLPTVRHVSFVEDGKRPVITFCRNACKGSEFDLLEVTSNQLEHEIKIDAMGNIYYKFPKVNKWILQTDVNTLEIHVQR